MRVLQKNIIILHLLVDSAASVMKQKKRIKKQKVKNTYKWACGLYERLRFVR